MDERVDVQAIMREIGARARNSAECVATAARPPAPFAEPALPDWVRVEGALTTLEGARAVVGELPPQPPTLRGRLGSLLVKTVRRALFWYTPQVAAFQRATSESLRELEVAARTLAAGGQSDRAQLGALRGQVQDLRLILDAVEKRLGTEADDVRTLVKAEVLPELVARQNVEARLEDALGRVDTLARAFAEHSHEQAELSDRLAGQARTQQELQAILNGVEKRLVADIEHVRTLLTAEILPEVAGRLDTLTRAFAEQSHKQAELCDRLADQGATQQGLSNVIREETLRRERLAESVAALERGDLALARGAQEERETRASLEQRVVEIGSVLDTHADALSAERLRHEQLGAALAQETAARGELAAWQSQELDQRLSLSRSLEQEVAAQEDLARRLDRAESVCGELEAARRGDGSVLASMVEALRSEQAATEALSQRLAAETAQRQAAVERLEVAAAAWEGLSRRLDEAESGCRELKAGQLSTAQLRERLAETLETEASARHALAQRVSAETAHRQGLTQRLDQEAGVREELTRRVDKAEAICLALKSAQSVETELRERIAETLRTETIERADLSQRLSAEVALRQRVVLRLEEETAARENLARDLAEQLALLQTLRSEAAAACDQQRHLTECLKAETQARAEFERRLAESRALLERAPRTEELQRKVDEAAAQREHLQRCIEAEIKARENLALHAVSTSDRLAQTERAAQESGRSLSVLRSEVVHQNRRLALFLEEARKRLPGVLTEKQLQNLTEQDTHRLDALYAEFEDVFRGTRAEIKERGRFYLPYLQERGLGRPKMPILDLGCGRGEWLELLRDEGLEARGIDTNRVFLESCRELGLNVKEDDLLAHLQSLRDASVGAVTGFHIIEHLPLDVLVQVVDETVRVLKPGGLAIFETPNPQNVLVGSHNFYIDLTHRNPLPPLSAQFLLEARGLCEVRTLGLHPYPEPLRLQDESSEVAKRFNEFFYGPQDYAVIGCKV